MWDEFAELYNMLKRNRKNQSRGDSTTDDRDEDSDAHGDFYHNNSLRFISDIKHNNY